MSKAIWSSPGDDDTLLFDVVVPGLTTDTDISLDVSDLHGTSSKLGSGPNEMT